MINFITKKPTRDLEGSSQFLAAASPVTVAEATVSGPVTDKLSVRFTALVDRNDGFAVNLANGHDIEADRTYGLRLAVRYVPTDTVTVDLAASRFFNLIVTWRI